MRTASWRVAVCAQIIEGHTSSPVLGDMIDISLQLIFNCPLLRRNLLWRCLRVCCDFNPSVLVDGGDTGSNFAADVYTNLKATVQVAKRNELHKFEVLPQRWIIERSFSWLDKCRRLWKNCERQLNTSRQMVILVFLVLLLKRF